VPFEIESEHLGAVKVIVPGVFRDRRGYFMEAYRRDAFAALGIPDEFVQDNQSYSMRGVVRGLHFQWDAPMAKLMRVTLGRAFLVAVDIRQGSPTLGQWFGIEASPGVGTGRLCARVLRAVRCSRRLLQVHGALQSGG